MTIETKIRGLLVITILTLLWMTIMWNNDISRIKKQNLEISKLKVEVDSLKNLSDSLAMENFPILTQLGRYEIAYEIFKERNPKAASQYGDIISNETE
jgi:hypothetical protein